MKNERLCRRREHDLLGRDGVVDNKILPFDRRKRPRHDLCDEAGHAARLDRIHNTLSYKRLASTGVPESIGPCCMNP